MILLAVSIITLCSTLFKPDLISSLYVFSILLYQLCDQSDTYKLKNESNFDIPRDEFLFLFTWYLEKPFRNYCIQKIDVS